MIPFVFWAPVALIAFVAPVATGELDVGAAAGLAVAGAALWTLAEYSIHRWLLHITGGPVRLRLNWLIHGVHHQIPADPHQAVFPPWVAIPFSAASLALALALLPWPEALCGYAGYTVSYLFSDWTHYATHHREPRTFVGRTARDRHLIHHFVDPTRGIGIATGLWDHLFRTVAAPLGDDTSIDGLLARSEGSCDTSDRPELMGYR